MKCLQLLMTLHTLPGNFWCCNLLIWLVFFVVLRQFLFHFYSREMPDVFSLMIKLQYAFCQKKKNISSITVIIKSMFSFWIYVTKLSFFTSTLHMQIKLLAHCSWKRTKKKCYCQNGFLNLLWLQNKWTSPILPLCLKESHLKN